MIKQAGEPDISIVEDILMEAVRWMDANRLHQWEETNVKWETLSRHYKIEDFYIAYDAGVPVACMALIDYDPNFWQDIPKGESLFLHKIAVKRSHAGKGFASALIDFAKDKARGLGIKTLHLDCHKNRLKVRAVYEKEGFICVGEKTLFGKYETAFYVYTL